MSSSTQVFSTRNQAITNYDTAKFLLGRNFFTSGNVTASGTDVTLTVGLVMGRIAATQLLVACDKDATDGSQLPVGICIEAQTILDGATATVALVNKGMVNENSITFADGTLATAVGPANNTKSYRDWLEALGLTLEVMAELTGTDNQ